MIYLDNNASTRPADEVVEVVRRAMREDWANPSSVHRAGQAVRQRVELARDQVAGLIGCHDREIVFTSGGTEAVNLAVRGSLSGHDVRAAKAASARVLIVTDKLEHSAVRETAEVLEGRGVETHWLNIDMDGVILFDSLRDVLASRANEIALVSVMWANNETGVIQPVDEISTICREFGVRLHLDATQSVGKTPVSVAELSVDLMSFSAHKFHGPKGVGALYFRRGVKLAPQITGGPQEHDHRGGTENVPGILGMGEAARLAAAWLKTDDRFLLASLRDRFERRIIKSIPGAIVNGAGAPRLWNTTNIAFPEVDAEALLLSLSELGVCASAGAACSSGSLDPSPVLLAMGLPDERVAGSIRFSISRETTDEELDRAAEIIISSVARLRTLTAGRPGVTA